MTDSTTPAQPPNSLPFSNLRTSEKIDKILPAFLAAWTEIEAATKDSLNPHFKSHYADLAACMEAIKAPLVKAGLLMMQPPKVEGKTISVETVVFHAASSQWLSSVFTLTSEDGKPQAIGSAISYARRYGLGAMFSLYSELDDDANKASTPPQQTTQAKQAPKAAPKAPPQPTNGSGQLAPNHSSPGVTVKEMRDSVLAKGVSREDLVRFYCAYFGKTDSSALPQAGADYEKPLSALLSMTQSELAKAFADLAAIEKTGKALAASA
jgi:hypothetical protein